MISSVIHRGMRWNNMNVLIMYSSVQSLCRRAVAAPGGTPLWFSILFVLLPLVISVGHGHVSTRTPLWNVCGTFVEVETMCRIPPPPPPPPTLSDFFRAGAYFYGSSSSSETFLQYCPPPPLPKQTHWRRPCRCRRVTLS